MHEDSEDEGSIDDFDNTKGDITLLHDSDEHNRIFLIGLIKRILSTCPPQYSSLDSTIPTLFLVFKKNNRDKCVSNIFGRVLRVIGKFF